MSVGVDTNTVFDLLFLLLELQILELLELLFLLRLYLVYHKNGMLINLDLLLLHQVLHQLLLYHMISNLF